MRIIKLVIISILLVIGICGCDFMGGMDTGYQKGGQYYKK